LIDRFQALQDRFDGVTVGSYPGQERVRVKLEGEDPQAVSNAAEWLEARIEQ